MSEIDVVVLDQTIHGMSRRDYRDVLRERLPEMRVELAATSSEYRELLPKAKILTASR